MLVAPSGAWTDIGTVEYRIGAQVAEAVRTTPEASDLQAYLRQMVGAGCRHAVLEVSSHSLAMKRVHGLEFEVAVRTGMIALDTFRVAMNFVILGATALALLLAFDYLRREGLDIGEFYFLVLMAAIGMMLLAGSRDLIVVFVSLELMSLIPAGISMHQSSTV